MEILSACYPEKFSFGKTGWPGTGRFEEPFAAQGAAGDSRNGKETGRKNGNRKGAACAVCNGQKCGAGIPAGRFVHRR